VHCQRSFVVSGEMEGAAGCVECEGAAIDVMGDGGVLKRVTTEGAAGGAVPEKMDTVQIWYTGTLANGTVFDSNRPDGAKRKGKKGKKGKSKPFELVVGR
jgi:hypothetical protein